jgi:hypothetical protein
MMSTEMDPGEITDQLRREFSLLDVPPGLTTLSVFAAGRRRRRRLLAGTVAVSVTVGVVAVGVPVALHARAGRPAVTAADGGTALWERCPPPDSEPEATAPPGMSTAPERQLESWRSTVGSERMRKTVEAKLRELSPGITMDRVFYMRGECRSRGQGGTVAYNFVRADGEKGALQVSVTRDPGDPADRAAAVVRTGRRQTTEEGEQYAVPPQVPADKPREQRTLDAGVHAVLYPEGVNGWEIPVDVFAPDDLTVVVQGERYRGPTGPAGIQVPTMKPSESPFSFDQLLQIGAAVAALR